MDTDLRGQFDAEPEFLNTASLGLPPRVTVAAMHEVVRGWQEGRLQPAQFDEDVRRARVAWARLSCVDPSWVATGPSVSTFVGLVAAASANGAQVLLDTTQSCGWLAVDCSLVDDAVCGAYKWLLSPRGTAFLSIRPERLDAIAPHAANWYAGGDVWGSIYGTPLRLATDARRFDISPAWLCWAGAAPSLELVSSLDPAAVLAHDVGLADAFLHRLGLPSQGSAIVTVEGTGAAEALAAAGVRAAVRAGRVRLSFHVYNDESDVDLAVTSLGAGGEGRGRVDCHTPSS